jgi:hypothetical protein
MYRMMGGSFVSINRDQIVPEVDLVVCPLVLRVGVVSGDKRLYFEKLIVNEMVHLARCVFYIPVLYLSQGIGPGLLALHAIGMDMKGGGLPGCSHDSDLVSPLHHLSYGEFGAFKKVGEANRVYHFPSLK